MGRKVHAEKGIKVALHDPEKAIEKATEFGKYQLFLLITLLWGNIIDTSNIVFMVFGGAEAVTCKLPVSYNLTQPDGNITTLTNCTGGEPYVFKSMIPDYGLERNAYVTALLTSVQLSGALFGALLGGFLSDLIGRRYNTWMWLVAEIVLGSLSALMPDWKTMMAMRFFIGFATGGYDSSVIILLMEWANPRTRLKMQNALMCINSVAFIWFAVLAYLTSELGWKVLSLISNLQGIPSVLAFFFIMETPRWLLLKGRTEQAIEVVRRVGVWNGNSESLSEADYDWESYRTKIRSEVEETSQTSYLDLFRSRELIVRVAMVAYSFLVCGLVGYVFVFNVGNLVGSIFLNFAIMGSVNVVAAIILSSADHFLHLGRRLVHQVSMIGVTLPPRLQVIVFIAVMIGIYIARVEHEYPALLITAAMIGSMFSFPLWTVCGLYSGELFPTELRNKSSGIGTMTSILGGILSPIVLTLFVPAQPASHPLPFAIVIATVVLNSVLAAFFLPETRGKLTEANEIPQ